MSVQADLCPGTPHAANNVKHMHNGTTTTTFAKQEKKNELCTGARFMF